MTGHRDGRVLLLLGLGIAIVLTGLVGAGGVSTATETTEPTANVSLYVTEEADFEDVGTLEMARENGSLEPAERMVVGETLVVAIDSDRLATDLDNRTGTTTERFFAALDGGANFTLHQTNPTTEIPPKVLRPGPENTTVYRNGSRIYVAIQTDAVTIRYDPLQDEDVDEPVLRPGERFAVSFGYGIEDLRSGPEIEFQETEAKLYGNFDPLPPELVNRTVAIRIEPETNVSVRVTLDDGTMFVDEPTPVSWSGNHAVTLDLRGIEPGTNYSIEVIHDGSVVDQRNGSVRDPAATLRNISLVVSDTAEYNAGRLNVTASLSHGGHVLVEDSTGQLVGSARVPPGTETRRSIPLMPRGESVDTFDPDELHLYAVRETPPGETPYPGSEAELTIDVSGYDWTADRETTTRTATPTPTPTQTVTATTSPSTSTTSSPTVQTTTRDGETGTSATNVPGFGIESVLLGLVAAAGILLLRRRSER